jgi:hypothetical protein
MAQVIGADPRRESTVVNQRRDRLWKWDCAAAGRRLGFINPHQTFAGMRQNAELREQVGKLTAELAKACKQRDQFRDALNQKRGKHVWF